MAWASASWVSHGISLCDTKGSFYSFAAIPPGISYDICGSSYTVAVLLRSLGETPQSI